MDNPNFQNESGHHTNGKNGYSESYDEFRSYPKLPQVDAPHPSNGSRQPTSKGKNRLKEAKSAYCPPSGEVATTLTLILTIIAIFLTARTVLGPIADVGGTVFALLILILLALIGGKFILFIAWLSKKVCKIEVRLPPLLGMLIVGILLKNIPYNFGQFGRSECSVDKFGVKHNASGKFVDSIHELDTVQEKTSFRRRREVWDFDDHDVVLDRVIRSVGGGHAEVISDQNVTDDICHPKYIGHDLDPSISRTLRLICLTVILLMAGLELDPVALKKLSSMVLRATFIPCFVEATVAAILAHFILGLPWTVGFMLGFVLAAVSPAVIIPSLMSLSNRGYGVAKGIPTLVIAACSADDVVAISGFGIFLGLTFNTGAPTWQLVLHGPIEVLIGVVFGIVWGFMAQWIPNKDHHHVAFFRWLILLGGGLTAVFGAHLVGFDGAGGLATIILAFIAGMEWRKEGWGDHNPVTKTFQRMWIILEPVIFALIGTEIQVDKIHFDVLGLSIAVLIGALVIRMIATYFSVTCGTLDTKEKIFMAFAWLPKATVQAALGPIFLDNVLKNKQEDWEKLTDDICMDDGWVDGTDMGECLVSGPGDWKVTMAKWEGWGDNILTLAVLSILITAPLGAVSILALGPKLLSNEEEQTEEEGHP